jgi:hypothetical protein
MKQERITSVDEVPPVKYHYKVVHIAKTDENLGEKPYFLY